MKIGEMASRAGCPVETVRYYEREGLLPTAERDPTNNYRCYDRSHLERLTFIRRCRTLDMAHSEIRALLEARAQPDASCRSINDLIDSHIAHVRGRIAELQALETQLGALRGQCDTDQTTQDCGILAELEQPGTEDRSVPASSHIAGVHAQAEPSSKQRNKL